MIVDDSIFMILDEWFCIHDSRSTRQWFLMILPYYSNLLRDFILNDLSTTFLQLSANGFCSLWCCYGAEAWIIPRVVRKPSCRWMLVTWLLGGCCRLNVSKNHEKGSSEDHQGIINEAVWSWTQLFFLVLHPPWPPWSSNRRRCWPRHFGSALWCLPSPVKAMMSSLSTLARGGGVTQTPPWNDRVIRNQLMAENKWPSSLNQPCFISLMKHEQWGQKQELMFVKQYWTTLIF